MKAHTPRRGFTLIELLTVIGIIVVLIAILVPTISAVRTSAFNADSLQMIQIINTGIQRYYSDYNAYPGPLSNFQVGSVSGTNTGAAVTSSENLVLGLMGGWEPGNVFDQDKVGSGPISHNKNVNDRRRNLAYIDVGPGNGLPGRPWTTGGGRNGIGDSNVPEFMDKFSDPMPILYMRANAGKPGVVANNNTRQYNRNHLNPYGDRGKDGGPFTVNTTDFSAGDADYFRNRQIPPTNTGDLAGTGTARGKDQFMLIGAGADREYGTKDDQLFP